MKLISSNPDGGMSAGKSWQSAKNQSMVAFTGAYAKKRKKRGAYIEKDIFKKRGRAGTQVCIY